MSHGLLSILAARAWRWPRGVVGLVLAALLAACGGGAGSGGVDTGGTGAPVVSFAAGRIAGFGSIVVNEVHYEDAGAAIVDEAGGPHRRDELRLGMTVQIQAGPVRSDARDGLRRADATRIQFGSEILGPVESVDAAAGRVRVLGQTVQADANTVLAGTVSVAALRAGDTLEVFAFFDPTTGRYTATRLERKGAVAAYKLRGPIAALNTTARTLTIGAAVVSYASLPAADVPGLAVGVLARAELQTTQQAGRWIATRLTTPLPAPAAVDGARTELEGFVTNFASRARFQVDGVTVDASGDVVFENGTAEQLANGARIEVEGRIVNDVLVAQRIEVRKPRDDTGNAVQDAQEFELRGAIESVDAAARSFVVRGTTVTFDADTRFDEGTATDLREGKVVEVKGTLVNGSRVRATRIDFEGE